MKLQPDRVCIGVCDDHPVFRAGLAALISDEPDLRLVFQVGTGAELVACLRDGTCPIDLLVLDFDLPDQHGLELVAEVSEHCKVLILSAFDDPDMIRIALERGAVGFVRKDSPPTVLLQGLRDAAGGHTVLNAEAAVRVASALNVRSPERDLGARLDQLTTRQRDVLTLLAEGRSNREIASTLFVTEGTVKNHVTQILQIVGVPDRTRLAVLLARQARSGGRR
ncbi:MAG: response regulator transcription factor [Myxococcales bacterium]